MTVMLGAGSLSAVKMIPINGLDDTADAFFPPDTTERAIVAALIERVKAYSGDRSGYNKAALIDLEQALVSLELRDDVIPE